MAGGPSRYAPTRTTKILASIGEPCLDTSNPKRPGARGLSSCMFLDTTALMKVLHDMLLPCYGAARYRGRRGSS